MWNYAGSLVINDDKINAVVGRIPHNTRVNIIKSEIVDDNKFYLISSAVGDVSILPTDLEKRKRAMDERPESDWWLPADEKFRVEGWVVESYLIDFK